MADGPPGSRRVFTGHRDKLDNLFRRKGGGRPRAWVIGQSCPNHGGERLVTIPVDFHLRQLGSKGEPSLAPRLHRPTIEVELAHHLALVGSRLQC
jgi:hypothetical protein